MFFVFASPPFFMALGGFMLFVGGLMIGRASARCARPRLEFDLG